MSYRPSVSLIQAPIAVDNAPNTTEPVVARALGTTPGYGNGGNQMFAGKAIVYIADGTTLDVTPWFKDPTLALWIRLAAPITLAVGVAQAFSNLPPLCAFFFQMTNNVGTVSKFGARFV